MTVRGRGGGEGKKQKKKKGLGCFSGMRLWWFQGDIKGALRATR